MREISLFVEDIVQQMNLERAKRADRSFRRFADNLSRTFQLWQSEINEP